MARYVIEPRSDWYPLSQDEPLLEGRTVFEPEPLDTGLLNANGHRILKAMDPVGFIRLAERK